MNNKINISRRRFIGDATTITIATVQIAMQLSDSLRTLVLERYNVKEGF